MALGELGNFTSYVINTSTSSEASHLNFVDVPRYAFAPASVVAPLGTVALIANCFIAPLMLHERFRKKDIVGIGFSIIGAVTIVLSAKSENKSVSRAIQSNEFKYQLSNADSLQLTPHQFIRAVSQPAFIVYASVSVGLTLYVL